MELLTRTIIAVAMVTTLSHKEGKDEFVGLRSLSAFEVKDLESLSKLKQALSWGQVRSAPCIFGWHVLPSW